MQTNGKIVAMVAVILTGFVGATSLSAETPQGFRNNVRDLPGQAAQPGRSLPGAIRELNERVDDLTKKDRDLFEGATLQIKKAAEIINALCTLLEGRGLFCPGAEAKIVFVTSSTHFGNIPSVAAADFFCNVRAQNAGLNGFFKAWISDSDATEPKVTFNQSTVAYVLPDGTLIAVDGNALFSIAPLLHPIDQDENGVTVEPSSVWTSTTSLGSHISLGNEQGTVDTDCDDWGNADPPSESGPWGIVGRTDQTLNWSAAFVGQGPLGAESCAVKMRLYCFEQ